MATENVDPAFVRSDSGRPQTSDQATGRRSAAKRLQQELMTLMTSGDKGISAFPESDNLFYWIATIEGPPGTVFENAVYKLRLAFPSDYPYSSPQVLFQTPCFHPNVDCQGNICVDILQHHWSALLDVRTVLLSIQSLLGEPNVASPLNSYAASIWGDKEEYQRARQVFETKQDGENTPQKLTVE
ncbi:ubiquitin-conjugating enzyme E2 C-like [Dermacentor andersoni]|uniref:ubiquitin-conjugating enzyme E2 C-like n=1 Tax=Dermacentor andersoni TaxID=34620 RepID=UPI003B3BB323